MRNGFSFASADLNWAIHRAIQFSVHHVPSSSIATTGSLGRQREERALSRYVGDWKPHPFQIIIKHKINFPFPCDVRVAVGHSAG